MEIPRIKWEKRSENDFVFFYDDYNYGLYVELLGGGYWWWNVVGADFGEMSDHLVATERQAKRLARSTFIKHLQNNPKSEEK